MLVTTRETMVIPIVLTLEMGLFSLSVRYLQAHIVYVKLFHNVVTFYSYTTQFRLLTTLWKRQFGNIVEKEGNTGG